MEPHLRDLSHLEMFGCAQHEQANSRIGTVRSLSANYCSFILWSLIKNEVDSEIEDSMETGRVTKMVKFRLKWSPIQRWKFTKWDFFIFLWQHQMNRGSVLCHVEQVPAFVIRNRISQWWDASKWKRMIEWYSIWCRLPLVELDGEMFCV